MPAVTVIIPTYNAEAFLAETLASVAQQSLRDFDVVLVDDGSTDGTLRIADQFASSMKLEVLSQPNAGPSAARNAGIRTASSRYCAFIDSDDIMLPYRLAEQAELLSAQPDLGLVHSDLMTFDETGIIHQTRRAFSDPSGGMILNQLLLDNFITTSTVMAPTERLVEAGLFDEHRRVSEDFDLWLRMARRWRIGYIDHPLIHYRRRSGSLSDDKLKTGLSALEVIESFWRNDPDYGRRHPDLMRKSLGKHLCVAGAAASSQRKHRLAFGYLTRSLRYDMANVDSWKWLVKTVSPLA